MPGLLLYLSSMDFREIVKDAMAERDITIRELAGYLANGDKGKTDTRRGHIRKWLNGEIGSISMPFLQEILEALDLEIVIKRRKFSTKKRE